MQSVCSVLPVEPWQDVIDARALASEDPLLGAIYDPPFAHFTHQLAEEYDWDGLSLALSKFAAHHQPFEAKTTGLQVFGGSDIGIVVAVFRSKELVEYQEAIWAAISPFANGNLPAFYEPRNWVPHVTIKRCGKHWDSFGRWMTSIVQRNFAWTFTIDNVSVQCDPGHNSRTHYQRLLYRLGDGASGTLLTGASNATIVDVVAPQGGETAWQFSVKPDAGAAQQVMVTAAQLARLMADARCSEVHFSGARCAHEDGVISAVIPSPPFAVVV